MRLHEAEYKINMNNQEVYNIATRLERTLLDSIDNHYNKLQQNQDGEDMFFEQEKSTINLMSDMYCLAGYRYIADSAIKTYKKKFEVRRKDRA